MVRALLAKIGTIAYALFIVAVGGVGIWGMSLLSGVRTFSEVQPALQTALAPFAQLFGVHASSSEPVVPILTAAGDIVALDEVLVQAPVGAPVASVHVHVNRDVRAGDVVVRLNDASAARAVRDARLELANARLELERLGSGTPIVAPVEGDIEGLYTAVASAQLNLPWITDGLSDIVRGSDVNPAGIQENMFAYADMVKQSFPDVIRYREKAAADLSVLQSSYAKSKATYEASSRVAPRAEILSVAEDTAQTVKAAAQALKSAGEFLAYVDARLDDQLREKPTLLAEHRDGVRDRAVTANDNLESLTNAQGRATPSAPVQQPVDDIGLRDAQLRVTAAEHVLADAEKQLEGYVVRAPVSGRVVSVGVGPGRIVVPGEVLVTIASPQNVARIGLTEAESSTVRVGHRADVSFDAIDGLRIQGSVIDIDPVATAAQGTVRVFARIAFDTHDERVKPGMSVTARFNRATTTAP